MIGAKTLWSSRSTKLKTLLSLFTHRSLTKNQSLSSSSRAICTRYHFQIPAKNPSLFFFICYFSAKPNLPPSKKQPPLVSSPCFTLTRDGNYTDGTLATAVCPGCGVHMQDSNPKLPGFFTKPSVKDPNYKASSHLVPVSFESEFSDSVKKGLTVEAENPDSDSGSSHRPEKPVVCARCHSLRHYGRVKDPNSENLLPEFDFYHTVGGRLVSTGGARSVVLLVVDAVDFDGSFPKGVVKLVTEAIEENYKAWKQGKSGNVPRIVLVVTKIDLLPTSLSPTRFEHWIRQRAREGGATSIKKVHFVSAVRDWGLKDLVEDVVELAGPRGNVWVVGTQNAGKSTLINALGKCVSGSKGKISHLTEASVPGTTLGIVRLEGVLPGNAKLFDTPGLLNPHQITTRLTRDEQKLVHIGKEVKPRTYRIKAGHSVHIGGLMRLDVEELSVDSVYITVWASSLVPLHMGKTERASTMPDEHFGRQLQPPVGEKRVQELGKWVRQEFRVSGDTWDSSSRDLAAGGLGWFAVGLKGEAVLGVWTYEGVDVVCRNSLIPYRSQNFEVAGFTVSKIVSQADQVLNKSQGQSEKEKKSSRKREAAPA